MSDSYVQVQPDSSGKKVDTSELTVNSLTVERQRVVLADDADEAGLAPVVDDEPGKRDYGIAVRVVPGGEDANLTHDLLAKILDKLDDLYTLMLSKG